MGLLGFLLISTTEFTPFLVAPHCFTSEVFLSYPRFIVVISTTFNSSQLQTSDQLGKKNQPVALVQSDIVASQVYQNHWLDMCDAKLPFSRI